MTNRRVDALDSSDVHVENFKNYRHVKRESTSLSTGSHAKSKNYRIFDK